MNRIDRLFKEKQEQILSVYMTAGYPARDDTVDVIRWLDEAGADLIEVGMPFSDPLADGPVIQRSSDTALKNGMSLKLLFQQLEQIRQVTDIPLILMGYLNPVLAYGFREFAAAAAETGIDGLILPDLPLEIYINEYMEILEEANLDHVMLITPQTSEPRIRDIAGHSRGFLYMVSDSATTGARAGISEAQLAYFQRIREMNLSLPRLIGFGISNHETFSQACRYANGAIIGSAFINAIEGKRDKALKQSIKDFIGQITGTDQE